MPKVPLGAVAVAGAVVPRRRRKAARDAAGRAREAASATGRRPSALVGPEEEEGAGIAGTCASAS